MPTATITKSPTKQGITTPEKPDSIQITATELKKNLGKYLKMSKEKDIYITKNDTKIAKLTNLQQERLAAMESLFGLASDLNMTAEEIHEERILKHAGLI